MKEMRDFYTQLAKMREKILENEKLMDIANALIRRAEERMIIRRALCQRTHAHLHQRALRMHQTADKTTGIVTNEGVNVKGR